MIYLCCVTSIGTAYSCGKHIAAWREPKLHICGIVMASMLQHGVNRCIVKTCEFLLKEGMPAGYESPLMSRAAGCPSPLQDDT